MEAKLHELSDDAKSQSMLFPSSFSIKKRQDQNTVIISMTQDKNESVQSV